MRFSILANRIMVLLLFQPIRFKYVSFDLNCESVLRLLKASEIFLLMNTIMHVAVPMLLTSTLQSLCKTLLFLVVIDT